MASADEILKMEQGRMNILRNYAMNNGEKIDLKDGERYLFDGDVYRIETEDGEKLNVYINEYTVGIDMDGYPEITMTYDENGLPVCWEAMSWEDVLQWSVDRRRSHPFSYPNDSGNPVSIDTINEDNIRDFIAQKRPTDASGADELLKLCDLITAILEKAGQTKPVEELAEEAGDDMAGVSLPALEQEERNRIK